MQGIETSVISSIFMALPRTLLRDAARLDAEDTKIMSSIFMDFQRTMLGDAAFIDAKGLKHCTLQHFLNGLREKVDGKATLCEVKGTNVVVSSVFVMHRDSIWNDSQHFHGLGENFQEMPKHRVLPK